MPEEEDGAVTSQEAPNASKGDESAKVVDPDDIQNAFGKFARKEPQAVLEMMQMEMSSAGNPLHRKMTPEHISKVIDLAACHDERQYELHKTSQDNAHSDGVSFRRYGFAVFVLLLMLTIIIIYLFKDTPEVLTPILTGVGGLVSGALGGWGFAKKS